MNNEKLDLILVELQKLNSRVDKIEQKLNIEQNKYNDTTADVNMISSDTKEILHLLNKLGYKLNTLNLINEAYKQLNLNEEFKQYTKAKELGISDEKLSSLKRSGADIGKYLDSLY